MHVAHKSLPDACRVFRRPRPRTSSAELFDLFSGRGLDHDQRPRPPVPRANVRLVATLALAALTGVLARRAGLEQGIGAFEDLAWVAATALEPALDADPTRPPAARADLGDLVSALVAASIVLRVQVLDASGRVLWSDDPRVVGEETPLRPEERRTLETGSLVSEIHDAQGPGNRAERDQGPTLEAYVGVRDVNGTPLLLHFYERYDEVTTIAWHTWWEFAPAALGALVLLQLVQVPLAWRLARRLRRSQEAEGALLHAAVDASEAERRRIAGVAGGPVVAGSAGDPLVRSGGAPSPSRQSPGPSWRPSPRHPRARRVHRRVGAGGGRAGARRRRRAGRRP
jgi:hypothetical protein